MSTFHRDPVSGLVRQPVRHDVAPGRRSPAGPAPARRASTGRPAPGLARPRVVVADGAALWRQGVARLLADAGMHVVGQAQDVPGLVEVALRARPDVVLLDPRLPATNADDGLRAARWIRRALPGVAVLLLGTGADPSRALGRLGTAGGGVGYLVKDGVRTAADLAAAVECVAMGGAVVDPATAERPAAPVAPSSNGLEGLSEREVEVLSLIAEGISNVAIAQRLGIAGKTVDSHVGRILAKLGLGEDAGVNRRVRAALVYLRAVAEAPAELPGVAAA